MEHNTGFSDDPEEASALLKTTSKKVVPKECKIATEKYLKPAIIVSIACLLFASIAFIAGHYSAQGDKIDLTLIDAASDVGLESYQATTTGLQPVKEGCLYLYPDNPTTNPNSIAYTVCNLRESAETTINDIGFSAADFNRGISYVVTGPNTWATLYEETGAQGIHTVIGPEIELDLEQSKDGNWNDRISSFRITKKVGDIAFLVKKTVNNIPGENCALLYGSNPEKYPGTRAIELCGKVGSPRSDFQHDTLLYQYKLTVEKLEGGVSYVATGDHAQLTLFQGKYLDGDKLVLQSGGKYNLNNFYDPDAPNGLTWSDVALSFSLNVSDY